MPDVLSKICADKRRELEARKRQCPQAELAAQLADAPGQAPRGFAAALERAAAAGEYGLICEIKKASPSKGVIRPDFDPAALAKAYEAGGASCLSVLTDTAYFQGRDDDLQAARAATALPVLRKDFTLDPYQVYEARLLGADCILLILAALEDDTAQSLAGLAEELGMAVLAEVHDGAELERALALPADVVGINNRDLKTLEVSLATTLTLAQRVSADRRVVAESGLDGPADLARCAGAGVQCFLIGESLMRARDVAAATRWLRQKPATAAQEQP